MEDFPRLLKRLFGEARAGRVDAAVAEIRDRMRTAESQQQDEVVADCYVALLAVLTVAQDGAASKAVRAERLRRFPENMDIRLADLETLVWVDRDYTKGLEDASDLMTRVSGDSVLYRKALYLKGLCHVELGDVAAAATILQDARYYDLTLAQKLIAHDAAREACRTFLKRAREWYRGPGSRSNRSDALANIARIDDMFRLLNRR